MGVRVEAMSEGSSKALGRLLAHRLVQAIIVSLLAMAVHSIGFRYISLGDTIPAETLPISIVKEGNFDLNEFGYQANSLPYWVVERKGRIIDFYPIVPALLNTPAFWIADKFGVDLNAERLWLTTWTCLWVTAASVGFTFIALSHFCESPKSAWLITIVYALGTVAWSVTSRCLWQHGPSLFFLTGAMACLLSGSGSIARPERRKLGWISWVSFGGFMLGMAVWNRPPNILFAVPLAVYVWIYHRKAFVAFAIFALIPGVLMSWYSISYWGDFWALGQGHRPGHPHGGHPVVGFSGPFWPGFMGVMFSPARGLFVFTPVFLLGLAYLPKAFFPTKSHPILPFVVMGLTADVFLFSKWNIWWGGHSFGYRMLIETVPAMILLLAGAWETWIRRRWWLQVLFWPLLGASVLFQYLGAFYYPETRWNYFPTNVDLETAKLWQVKDSELTRDFRAMRDEMEER